MDRIATFENILWLMTEAAAMVLVFVLIRSKNFRQYPVFLSYVVITLVQNLILFATYRVWGFSSPISSHIAWTTQFVAICARAAAVLELSRHAMARYRGIWKLTWRVLLVAVSIALVCSVVLVRGQLDFLVLYADRGLELSMALGLVGLFVFTKHYDVEIGSGIRSLAIGFCLYSCFYVLNDTVLERWLSHYANLWNVLGTITFFASLSIWIWAMRKTQLEPSSEQALLPSFAYPAIIPHVHGRLRVLNDQLSQVWKAHKS